QVQEGAGADLLVISVLRVDGEVEPAYLAAEAALGAERVEVDSVAAAHLGDQGELGGEVEYPLAGARHFGSAVLHEAVENVAVQRVGAGQHPAAGAEPLGDHELVELLRRLVPYRLAFRLGYPVGYP